MNGKFFLASYEMVAQEGGNVVIARFIKQTDIQSSSIVGVKNDRKVGFAGTMELHVYDEDLQGLIKENVGQEFDVNIL